MTTLHLVSNSSCDCIERCLTAIAAGDEIILHAEGVLAALPTSKASAGLRTADARVLALADDCSARGISDPCFSQCTYAEWVALVALHTRTVSWT